MHHKTCTISNIMDLTKEKCKELALMCQTRTEFHRRFGSAVKVSKKNGWYEEICIHMPSPIHQYTKEECSAEARKYNKRGDFQKYSHRHYQAALRKRWLDEICGHMTGRVKRTSGWWEDINHCKETALLYDDLKKLRKEEKGCYESIYKHGWQEECLNHIKVRRRYTEQDIAEIASIYDDYYSFRENYPNLCAIAISRGIIDRICSHMSIQRKVSKKYDEPLNKENCIIRAQKYRTRSAFQKSEDGRFYNYALRNGFLDEICGHMERIGNLSLRCIYVATFSDNHAYIGLTGNADNRWKAHLRSKQSAIYKHMQKTGLSPKFKRLTDYMTKEEASIQEGKYKEKYQKEGWIILNIAKTGALGGLTGYSKDEVLEEAAKYTSLRQFRLKSPGYYESGYRSDYWDEVRAICHPQTRILTEETITAIALQCTSIAEFRKKDHAALDKAMKLGILDKICMHMDRSKEKHKISEEEIQDAVSQSLSFSILRKKFPHIYAKLCRTGRIESFYPDYNNNVVVTNAANGKNIRRHLSEPQIVILDAEIREAVQKCCTLKEFKDQYPHFYNELRKRNRVREFCADLANPRNTTCISLDDAKSIALTFENRTLLKIGNPKAYEMLRKAGMLEEYAPKKILRKPEKWTPENRRAAAIDCKSRKEFKHKYPQAYEVARAKGELDDICSHMESRRRRWTDEEIIGIISQVHNMKELKDFNHAAWAHMKSRGLVGRYKNCFKK